MYIRENLGFLFVLPLLKTIIALSGAVSFGSQISSSQKYLYLSCWKLLLWYLLLSKLEFWFCFSFWKLLTAVIVFADSYTNNNFLILVSKLFVWLLNLNYSALV